jgi:apolipoprotein D and lipocalin family protein
MYTKIIYFLFLISNTLSLNADLYQPVDSLDLNSYMGRWYQVYGNNFDKIFERGSCVTADYAILDSNNVSVLNTQINQVNKPETISGYAYYTDNHTGGELTVQLDGQGEAPYWVIELGPIVNNQYDYAIVSDNVKLSLFVLARDVENYFKYYNDDIQESLKNFGFTRYINKPLITNQTNCTYY